MNFTDIKKLNGKNRTIMKNERSYVMLFYQFLDGKLHCTHKSNIKEIIHIFISKDIYVLL
jgi:hypothetical protein